MESKDLAIKLQATLTETMGVRDLRTAQKLYAGISSVIVDAEEIDNFEYIDCKAAIRSPGFWADDLINPAPETGCFLPWPKTHNHIRLPGGELTLWAGYNGHKKSLATGHIMLHAISQGEKVCIASLEMPPKETLKRLCIQATGAANPSTDYKHRFLKYVDGKLFIYDQADSVTPSRINRLVEYCAAILKCKHILIDSLMTIDIDGDDYNSQKTFVRGLAALAKKHDVHIHLVSHVRKPQHTTSLPMPTRYEIAGTGNISNYASNVFVVWENEAKIYNKQKEGPDMVLGINKQRNRKFKGNFLFDYDDYSLQMIEDRKIEYI